MSCRSGDAVRVCEGARGNTIAHPSLNHSLKWLEGRWRIQVDWPLAVVGRVLAVPAPPGAGANPPVFANELLTVTQHRALPRDSHHGQSTKEAGRNSGRMGFRSAQGGREGAGA